MISITKLRHSYPENAGMCIDRKNGYPQYTFLHFFKSVELLVDGKIIETEPNAIIIYDIDSPQYFYSKIPLVHDWMHFTGNIEGILDKTGLQLDKLYYPSQSEFITAIIKEMETEFYSNLQNRNDLIMHKFSELFIKLGRAVSGEMSPYFDRQTRTKFRNLRGEVFSDLGKKWTVSQMAQTVGFSQSRFFSIYKSIYGISPTADLIGARIDSAKNMLTFSNLKIEEIAYSLGYDNITHFIRQFKKETGVSPTTFRKNN